MASRGCLTPLRETLSEPGFAQRVLGVAAGRERWPFPGPGREDLLRIVA